MNKQSLKILIVCVVIGILSACRGGGGAHISVTAPHDPLNKTETVAFEFSDFSEVEVAGPFYVSLLHGNEFSVALTVDTHVVNALNIEQSGQTLHIGFRSGINIQAETLEVVIVMPALTRVSLAGATYSLFSGFTGPYLDVELIGAAVLEGLSVSYDFVMLRAIGASQFLMEDVQAIPAAHAVLTGASTATFNMMDSGTLTGPLSAASTLFYYGSDVLLDVETDLTTAVQRLGDTLFE